jgi:peptidylprolyl isomerase
LRAVKALMSVIAVCALALIGCGSDDSAGETTVEQSNLRNTKAEPQIGLPESAPPTVLVEEELVEGTGPAAKAGDTVTVEYAGFIYANADKFDSSWEKKPFTFTLDRGEVIDGWDQGIRGMKVGSRRLLTIPPGLAFDETGLEPLIPPNETVIFIIDLLAIK